MQRILYWAFDLFVMLWEGSISHHTERHKDSRHSFRIHNERPHVILWSRIYFEVRNIDSYPFLSCFVPPDLLTLGIPRLAVDVTRSAVVQHAAICRPRPPPVRIDTQSRRIIRSATLHHRACLSPR